MASQLETRSCRKYGLPFWVHEYWVVFLKPVTFSSSPACWVCRLTSRNAFQNIKVLLYCVFYSQGQKFLSKSRGLTTGLEARNSRVLTLVSSGLEQVI